MLEELTKEKGRDFFSLPWREARRMKKNANNINVNQNSPVPLSTQITLFHIYKRNFSSGSIFSIFIVPYAIGEQLCGATWKKAAASANRESCDFGRWRSLLCDNTGRTHLDLLTISAAGCGRKPQTLPPILHPALRNSSSRSVSCSN